jgi:hypothetical protein
MTKSYERDPHELNLDERLSALSQVEAEIAHLQARSARIVAAIVDDPCEHTPAPLLEKEYVREELRTVLHETAVSINNRIELARTLTHRLPTTLAALEHGQLSHRHARLLVEAIAGLPDTDATAVETACLPFATGRDTGAFARKLRREVLALDSRTVEERTRAALADRHVWLTPNRDSATATLAAVLPADGAQHLMTALDIAADRTATDQTAPADPAADDPRIKDPRSKDPRAKDPRSKDQRRADALVQLGIDALNRFHGCPHCRTTVVPDDNPNATDERAGSATPPRWHGARPTIQVAIALSTLLGLDNQPGELSGHGPIPATLARHIAADPTGTWRRLITDQHGHVLDYGRTRYRPPADLRDFVIARDATCRFPGCSRPACRCELDHITAWAHGGHTNPANTIPLCCRHHHTKHDTDWTLQANPDGSHTWTSPTGRHHRVDPTTYPIDHTHELNQPDLPRAG